MAVLSAGEKRVQSFRSPVVRFKLLLLSSELLRWQIGVVDKKTGQPRDLTAFQWPNVDGISRDGSMILLNSFDIMTNGNYRLYVQRTDGSVPVLVGEGAGTGFSADGKWVTAVDPVTSERASVIPRVWARPKRCRHRKDCNTWSGVASRRQTTTHFRCRAGSVATQRAPGY